jgi:hypothetical protein
VGACLFLGCTAPAAPVVSLFCGLRRGHLDRSLPCFSSFLFTPPSCSVRSSFLASPAHLIFLLPLFSRATIVRRSRVRADRRSRKVFSASEPARRSPSRSLFRPGRRCPDAGKATHAKQSRDFPLLLILVPRPPPGLRCRRHLAPNAAGLRSYFSLAVWASGGRTYAAPSALSPRPQFLARARLRWAGSCAFEVLAWRIRNAVRLCHSR